MRRPRSLLALFVILALGAPASARLETPAGTCGSSESLAAPLPTSATVRDPVFAILFGLLNEDRFGSVSAETLAEEVRRSGRSTPLPYQRIRRILRERGLGRGDALVTLELDGPFRLPIPYRILFFYRPGDIWSEARLEATEWRLGALEVSGTPAPAPVTDVHLFALTSGQAGVDIDGWLDRLLGARIDDMSVDGFATFVSGQQAWGLALGRSPRGARRFGLFDLTADKIAFPAPPALKPVARRLRTTLEALSASAARVSATER